MAKNIQQFHIISNTKTNTFENRKVVKPLKVGAKIHTYMNNVESSSYHFPGILQIHTASFKGYFRQVKNFGNTEHLPLIISSPLLLCWCFFPSFLCSSYPTDLDLGLARTTTPSSSETLFYIFPITFFKRRTNLPIGLLFSNYVALLS